MTIVSIRGTHGSGKSTIVMKVMKKLGGAVSDWAPGPITKKRKPLGYYARLNDEQELYIVGPYESPCGGCDAIQPYKEILPRIQDAAEAGHHVLFEGALVASSYGTIGAWMGDNLEHDPVFAFLDTPLDLCLERVQQRRAARGNFEPLNPHNTTVKFENVARTKDQMRRLGSQVRIVDIRHTHAVMDVMKLFGVTLRKEPV